ncbi:flagellar protein FlaG [Massilia sp. PWRC2]|uniref:flagellar protein FlaG n=1 Tax=Massilia sp. PWRC2 TaxID=2804626 RepID=UPI003CEA284B
MDIRSVSSSPAAAPPERDAGAARTAAAARQSPAGTPAAPAPASVSSADASATVAAARPAGAVDALDEAVKHINKSLQANGQGVEFSIDEDSKRLVVKVVDQETREVLRQMPSVEALQIAKGLDRAKGMLIKHEA